jgi:hypothetical protein
LRELTNSVQDKLTCLLCFERDPETCHRSIVAQKVVEQVGFDILNLYADDPNRYVRNAPKLSRFYSGEGASAA